MMIRRFVFLIVMLTIGLLVSPGLLLRPGLIGAFRAEDASKPPSPRSFRSTPIEAFRLPEVRSDKNIDLDAFKDAKAIVLVFLGTQCPLSNEYLLELARLHKTYSAKNVPFVGINSNRQDSPAAVKKHAIEHDIAFPVVKDPANKIADSAKATRTPEVVVLSPDRKILYQGRIDDQFGIGYRRAGKPTRRDLVEALEEILAEKKVSVTKTEAPGCKIGRVKEVKETGKVTFSKDISRILQNNCQECHRAGQIGPMSLIEYDDVVAWSDTIREVVEEGRMPPWHADPKHGKWSNERKLSKQDKDTLLGWLREGMPRGDLKDMPAPKKFTDGAGGWKIGEPDVVLSMPKAFEVPAETPPGGVPYKYFTLPTEFKEDRWVERAEARPGAADVVHHILVFILPPGQLLRPELPGTTLTGMAPGDMPLILKPGQAKLIPAGSRLIMQMHYTPNGKARSDRSSVGLVFAKKPPTHRVMTIPIHDGWFRTRLTTIPPGHDNFKIETTHTFKEDVQILSFLPHMHLRGKNFTYTAINPEGNKEILLHVPKYDFNWQSIYRAEKPIALKKGSKMHCVAHFDNSAKNPNNPDPKQRVGWGDQTWEEMMVGWVDYMVEWK